jgi:Lon-like protease
MDTLPPRPDAGPFTEERLPAPPEPQAPRSRLSRLVFLIPVLALAVVLYFIPLPYYVISPGSAEDVEPLIRIRSHQVYPSQGHFLLTDVYLYQPNTYRAFWAWIDRTEAVVPQSEILAPGETPQQNFQVALSQMDTSKIDAAVVALTEYTDYPEEHRPGVLVESVATGTPAEGRLFAGDLIVAVDGDRVTGLGMMRRRIRAAGAGHELTFTVTAGGETRTVRVAPKTFPKLDHPAIGVVLVNNFPFPLTIESGNIGGPSAGLMWTLGLVELLTPGDLTGGERIAGTGTIDLEGSVGPIGGVEQKVVAAERAGATVFFVPIDNAAAARSIRAHITLVPVKTYQDALRYLQAHSNN